MNFKNKNILLTSICLVLFVAGFLVNDPFSLFESTYQKSAPLLKGFSFDKIKKITVQAPAGKKIFTRTADGWNIETPRQNQTLRASVKKLEEAMKQVLDARRYQEVSSNKDKFSEFEVTDNDLNLTLEPENGNSVKVQIGKNSASSNASFVRVSGEDKVYSVKGFLKNDWNADINSFRDRAIMKFIPDNVKAVAIKGARTLGIRIDDKGIWNIDAIPLPRPGDKKRVEQLLREISETEGNRFYEGPIPSASFGVISLTFQNNFTKDIEFKGPVKEGDYLVKSSDNPFWMTLGKAKVDSFFVKNEEFEEKKAPEPR